MKIKFSHVLTIAVIAFGSLVSVSLFAQDEGRTSSEFQDVNHQEVNTTDEEKMLPFEHESKSTKNISSETHQSQVITPVKPKATETHKANSTSPNSSNSKDGDDALSFNFLFYIIQKYKFSDIIDQ